LFITQSTRVSQVRFHSLQAIGKNKKLGKKRKGAGRKMYANFISSLFYFLCAHSEDPFKKKDWFEIRTPSVFNTRKAGYTIATKSSGLSEFS
jgi:small subunit ribosomal protein S3Ae